MNMRKIDIVICAALAVIVWSVFGQTLGHDFVNYDDRVYVTQAPQVSAGLTISGIVWAFTHAHAGNWHPLTTLTHMVDCQLFGLRPGPHHAVNVTLHMFAVVLLFIFLRLTTGRIWPSAFVAAVFAIHPLRVESVAWIAERKDVLSAFFFMLTLVAYARYAQTRSLVRYLTMSIFAACGLLSKSMLVTLPLVLLLVDYWPLARSTWSRLLIEKIPLFAMSLGAGVVTYVIQQHSPGAVAQLPLSLRVGNAVISYVIYLRQTFWPSGLVVFYPHPEQHLAFAYVALAGALLIAVSVVVVVARRAMPAVFVGWFWHAIMLLPVIGIIEVGLQGHADRYTYLPQIGLIIALTWLVLDRVPARAPIVATAGVVIVASLGAAAFAQTRTWKNSETLWRHALAVSPDNDVAHANLGRVLLDRDDADGAIGELETALSLNPNTATPHHALELAIIHNNLGEAFTRKGVAYEAAAEFRKSIALQPNYADAHYNLGVLLAAVQDNDGAIEEFKSTLAIRPEDAEAHTSLANSLLQKGALKDAVAHYSDAVKAPFPSVVAANNLAWVLATASDDSLRNGPLALELARRAVSVSQDKSATFVRTLAAAYAETGDFEDARATAERAQQIARANNDVDLAPALENDVELYRNRRPLRDPGLTNAP